MIHAGLNPVYIVPKYSDKLGVTLGVTPQELQCALDEHPEIRGIFLTYPNYFGIATNIDDLVRICNHQQKGEHCGLQKPDAVGVFIGR